jgi:hypothetical protein
VSAADCRVRIDEEKKNLDVEESGA